MASGSRGRLADTTRMAALFHRRKWVRFWVPSKHEHALESTCTSLLRRIVRGRYGRARRRRVFQNSVENTDHELSLLPPSKYEFSQRYSVGCLMRRIWKLQYIKLGALFTTGATQSNR